MDWLKDGIVDFLVGVYTSFFSGVQSLFELAQMSPAAWHDGVLWNAVTQFNKNAVLPIAYSLLSLFLLLELASIFKRADVRGIDTVRWCSQVLLKIAIAKLVMDNMDLIIASIFDVASSIVSSGQQYFNTSGQGTISNVDQAALADSFANKNVLDLLCYFLFGTVLQGAQQICFLLCRVLIQLRFIEIYAFTALCALPFATFPSQEYSQIFKSYIKRMAALALHVVFICVCLYMYTIMINTASFVIASNEPLNALISAFGYTLLLVIALFQTGGWSKQLTGAN